MNCKSIGCRHEIAPGFDFCSGCLHSDGSTARQTQASDPNFKSLGDMAEIDVYGIHFLFQIQDPSGCLQHASRLILTNGAKPSPAAIREARDVLTRWLQLNPI